MDPFETARSLADSPELVLTVYALVLTPLALYVYHDILDKRWRPVWRISRYLLSYFLLYITSGSALIAYIVIQALGQDFKEVGASALAFILGTYGAWRLVRLMRIIIAHHSLVKVLQRIDCSLALETGLEPVGLEYHLFRHPKATRPLTHKPSQWLVETRHDFISSVLFDDDYPGDDAVRIRWLGWFGKRVVVLDEDAEECAARVAIWMRLVLRRPRSEPWRLLTSTSPLVKGQRYSACLGEALRALISSGSAKKPPRHANPNPAQVLFNKIEENDLTEAAVGFFWIASEMSSEEMNQVLAQMPPKWMRRVTQNGKQLMFELIVSLILCEMPLPENLDMQWVLSLPVLQWKEGIENVKVHSILSEICADAVCSVMPQLPSQSNSSCDDEVRQIVRDGVLALQEAKSTEQGFDGTIVGLSLLDLIRASYRSGYIAEQILGRKLEQALMRQRNEYDQEVRIYKAEIVTGLFSILQQLGQDGSDEFRDRFSALKSSWGVDDGIDDMFLALRERAENERRASFQFDHVAQSRWWYLCEPHFQCEDPIAAFETPYKTAMELAPLVVQMLRHCKEQKPGKYPVKGNANPDRSHERWMEWRQTQAHDISGSREILNVDMSGTGPNAKGIVTVPLW